MGENQSGRQKSENVQQALSLLKQPGVDPAEAFNLGKKLKAERAIGYARQLLAHALEHPDRANDPKQKITLLQQLPLCTYKDPDLPPATSLDDAYKIIDEGDPLATTRDQETLGIAGAIFKRKWEHDNHKQCLERALAYYRHGYLLSQEKGWTNDQGYNAINTAFTLDLLALSALGVAGC